MSKFLPVRADGRSDVQVILEMLRGAEPDTLFTYQQMADALGVGIDTEVTREKIQRAAVVAIKRLEEEEKRTATVMPRLGYRIARANEHSYIAGGRKRRGTRQLARGRHTLESTRLDELTQAERSRSINDRIRFTLYEQILVAHETRLNRQDQLIESLFKQQEDRQRQEDQTRREHEETRRRVEALENG